MRLNDDASPYAGMRWDVDAIRKLTQKEKTGLLRTKKIRVAVRAKVRYELISAHPYCTLCGRTVLEGIRLEVDHIDGNPSNNKLTNLQVLCNECNVGKGG